MLKSEQNQEDLDYLNAHTGLGEPEVQVGSLIVMMMMMMMMMVHHWWSVPPLLKSWMPKFQNFWLVGRLKRSSQCEDVIFLEFSGGSFLGLPQMARPSQTHPSTRFQTKCHGPTLCQEIKNIAKGTTKSNGNNHWKSVEKKSCWFLHFCRLGLVSLD